MGRKYKNKQTSKQSGGAPHQLLVIIVTFLLGYFTAVVFDIGTVSHWVNTQVLSHKTEPRKAPKEEQAAISAKPKFEFYTLLANEKTAASNQASQANAQATAGAAKSAQPVAHATQANATTNTGAVVVSHAASSTAPAVLTQKTSPATKTQLSKDLNAAMVPHMPPERPQAAAATISTGSFGIQVASFRTQKDAEHMRGVLALKGFSVHVVPVSQPRGNWYRVVVGPYSNKALAQKTQGTLARNERLQGMVIRLK